MQIDKAVLATIAYYDALDYPLSSFEIYRYLVNPQRLQPHIESLEAVTLKDIFEAIEELIQKGSIKEELGFYSLKDREGLSVKRLEQEKISAQKWRKCLRLAYWLQAAPWVRGMFASGSLALGTVNKDSDFDILVIVEEGRLYLSRLFLSGVASLLGARRTRFEKIAPDKFCFNHYVTNNSLYINHQSLYTAQTFARLVPIHISSSLVGEFFAANIWINKFVYNFTPHGQTIRRKVTSSKFLQNLSKLIEIFLNTSGEVFERWARQYQQKRISSNPATHAPGGRIVYTTTELEFHPYSFEKVVLDRYNETTRRLGLSINAEPDSGLKQ